MTVHWLTKRLPISHLRLWWSGAAIRDNRVTHHQQRLMGGQQSGHNKGLSAAWMINWKTRHWAAPGSWMGGGLPGFGSELIFNVSWKNLANILNGIAWRCGFLFRQAVGGGRVAAALLRSNTNMLSRWWCDKYTNYGTTKNNCQDIWGEGG